ncbi:hypothetical protein D3C80_1580370 [compost metagenome]
MPTSVAARRDRVTVGRPRRPRPAVLPGKGSHPRPGAPVRQARRRAGLCPCAAPAAGESPPTSRPAAGAGAATDAGSARYADDVRASLAEWSGRLQCRHGQSATVRDSTRWPTRPGVDAQARAPTGCRFLRNSLARSRPGQRRDSKAAAGARLQRHETDDVAHSPSDLQPDPAGRVRLRPAPDGCGCAETTG